MNKFVSSILVVLLAGVLLFGCVEQPPRSDVVVTPVPSVAAAASSAGQVYTVSIRTYYFEPAELTVSQGDSVTWVNVRFARVGANDVVENVCGAYSYNDDRYAHSIDFGGYGSDALTPGETYSMEFDAVGDYP